MTSSPNRWNSGTQDWHDGAGGVQYFGTSGENGGEIPLDARQILSQELHPAPRRNFGSILLLVVALVVFALIYFGVKALIGPKSPPAFQDLGAGVSNAEGLRGNLSARWVGRVEYQLKFQALNSYENRAFSYVVAHPPHPYSFHIRLLDSTGFTLCSKEIVFPANPARIEVTPSPFPELVPKPSGSSTAGQSAAQAGKGMQQPSNKGTDIFQDQVGDDGQISAFTAQGTLPCTAAQYRQFNYWDFSSNFPTLSQQRAIANAPRIAAERKAAAEREALRRKYEREHPSAFYLSGDTNVNYFDSTSGVMEVGSGQRFRILNEGNTAIANKWANDNIQVQYKCDQFAACQLSDGSAAGTIRAKSVP